MADGDQKYPNRWKAGQSGNPKGRPRTGTGLAQAIQRMVVVEDMVNFCLDRIKGSGYSEKDKQWAMDWLARQGFKLPAQVVEVAQVELDEALEVEKMSTAELEALVAE